MDVDLPAQLALELVGVFVGALSGGLAAVRKGFDIFGILVLAWAAGLGGGFIRDLMIGAIPPVGISDWRYVATAVGAGVVTWALHVGLGRIERLVLVLDAGALALFTAAGTLKAIEYEVGPLAAVFAGVITGVGGGMLRDLLTAEVPVVFAHRQLYAVPSLLGAGFLTVLAATGNLSVWAVLGSVLVVFGIRLIALRFRLQAPGPLEGMPHLRRHRRRGSEEAGHEHRAEPHRHRPTRAPSVAVSRLLRRGRPGGQSGRMDP